MSQQNEPSTTEPQTPQTGLTPDEKAELEALRKEKEKWAKNDQDLIGRVKDENDEKLKRDLERKELEDAITFRLSSSEFLKQNEGLLPSEIKDIFEMASREKYDDDIQRAKSIKSAIIQQFFSLQSNVDLLTSSQKSTLADYLKLTKNGKEEKSKELYTNLFEPTLESLKRIKKAQDLAKAKSGLGGLTSSEESYKKKLMELAEKKWGKK